MLSPFPRPLGPICGYAKGRKVATAILTKKTEVGNFSFRIVEGKVSVAGSIEAKDFGNNLNVEDREQLLRFRAIFRHVFWIRFTGFRWHREGQLIEATSITRLKFVLK